MGNWTECWLDNLFVGSTNNDIDFDIISLFRPQDKVITSSLIGNVSVHLKDYQEWLDDGPDRKIVYYEAPVSIVRDRLDLLGYDFQTAKEAFSLWIKEEHKSVLQRIDKLEDKDSKYRDLFQTSNKQDSEILSELSPEQWIHCLKEINDSCLETNYTSKYEGPHKGATIGYMLSNKWFGFPGYDLFVPLRLAVEAINNSKKLIYDVTSLVSAKFFDYDVDFVEYGRNISAYDYISCSKTIVLTEGKFDSW